VQLPQGNIHKEASEDGATVDHVRGGGSLLHVVAHDSGPHGGHCDYGAVSAMSQRKLCFSSSSEMEEQKRGGGGAIGFSSCHRKQQANTSGMEV